MKKNSIIVRLAIVSIAVFLLGFIFSIVTNADEITQKFVRFHIIGNSDGIEDQTVKMKIREKIFEELSIPDISSKEEAVNYFIENKEYIESIANKTLAENNFDYKASVKIGKKTFPIREYTNFTLPAGVYDAVSVELGNAGGANFFCVMYPGLCIIDGISEKTDTNAELMNNVLTEKEVKTITGNKVVVKFKVAEILNKLIQ